MEYLKEEYYYNQASNLVRYLDFLLKKSLAGTPTGICLGFSLKTICTPSTAYPKFGSLCMSSEVFLCISLEDFFRRHMQEFILEGSVDGLGDLPQDPAVLTLTDPSKHFAGSLEVITREDTKTETNRIINTLSVVNKS